MMQVTIYPEMKLLNTNYLTNKSGEGSMAGREGDLNSNCMKPNHSISSIFFQGKLPAAKQCNCYSIHRTHQHPLQKPIFLICLQTTQKVALLDDKMNILLKKLRKTLATEKQKHITKIFNSKAKNADKNKSMQANLSIIISEMLNNELFKLYILKWFIKYKPFYSMKQCNNSSKLINNILLCF